jgi:hypothetical protein
MVLMLAPSRFTSSAEGRIWCVPSNFSSTWSSWTFLKAHSQEKLKTRLFFFFTVVSFSPMPNLQPGGPPLVDCPLLTTHYIYSYPPELETVCSTWNLKIHSSLVMRGPPNIVYQLAIDLSVDYQH